MSTKAFAHHGLGGSVRRESGELHLTLNNAFSAGRDAAIKGVVLGKNGVLRGMSQDMRREWMKGYKSICK
jgi:hypothetical protein